MLPLATFADLGAQPSTPRCPEDHSWMKQCLQNALWKTARRPMEPLSAQIDSMATKIVAKTLRRAIKRRQHRTKTDHIVLQIVLAPIADFA